MDPERDNHVEETHARWDELWEVALRQNAIGGTQVLNELTTHSGAHVTCVTFVESR